MEELVWKFRIFGVEIGWTKYRTCDWFDYWESCHLLYFRKLRIWFYKKYYKDDGL